MCTKNLCTWQGILQICCIYYDVLKKVSKFGKSSKVWRTSKIIGLDMKGKKYAKCYYTNKRNIPVKDHTCSINYEWSSGVMESKVALTLTKAYSLTQTGVYILSSWSVMMTVVCAYYYYVICKLGEKVDCLIIFHLSLF